MLAVYGIVDVRDPQWWFCLHIAHYHALDSYVDFTLF